MNRRACLAVLSVCVYHTKSKNYNIPLSNIRVALHVMIQFVMSIGSSSPQIICRAICPYVVFNIASSFRVLSCLPSEPLLRLQNKKYFFFITQCTHITLKQCM